MLLQKSRYFDYSMYLSPHNQFTPGIFISDTSKHNLLIKTILDQLFQIQEVKYDLMLAFEKE